MKKDQKLAPNSQLEKAAQETVAGAIQKIHEIDCSLYVLGIQLDKIQPLLSGKITLILSNDFSHSERNKRVYATAPSWVRLVKRKKGGWFIRKPNSKERSNAFLRASDPWTMSEFKKIRGTAGKIATEDELAFKTLQIQSLRVSAGLPCDATVRKIISKICELIALRDEYTDMIATLRSRAHTLSRTADKLNYDASDYIDKLISTQYADWTENAAELYKSMSSKARKKAGEIEEESDDELEGPAPDQKSIW